MNPFLLDDGRLRSGWRFLLSVVMVVAANFIAGNLSVLFAGNHYRIQEVIYRPLLMALEIVSFLFLAKVFDQSDENAWSYIGLRSQRWLRDTIEGALLGLGMVTLAVVVIAVAFKISVTVNLNAKSLATGIAVLAVLLAAAMAEELMFRGYPFQRLVEGLGATGAIVVLSALFGLVHMQNPHVSDDRWVQVFAFSNTLLIGVVLAICYLRTKALWLPWGLHFGWNATLGTIYGLPVSGINQFAVMVKGKVSGPEWLLGGRYVLEGGMLGTIIIVLGLVYVLRFVRPVLATPASSTVAEPLVNSIQSDSGA